MTAESLAPTMPDLTALFLHAGHVLNTRLAAALSAIGVTPRSFCVLAHAVDRNLTQAQVAEVSDLDKTTMVVTMDELEKAGLAERRPAPTDRRARIIVVTDSGRDLVRAGREIVDGVNREVLDTLPDDERRALVSAMERLVLGGILTTPVETDVTVRRARAAKK
ncbi:MarR family transcriptional regulator [Streptomyces sp. SID3343]|uniref:MarR family winged helix-turn-helix transcriptional regulator n=1 Tax=Streptomyces sp. SID3343 TaxID=2690260 RepID=UPI0013698B7F|nr:MarR family transcriptional regulator [Streptomyces sp. SID3343]MYW05040.1 MarR family transcriptional regulator [Streptomyces sp. SID3343]